MALLTLETIGYLSLRIGAFLPLGLLTLAVTALLIWVSIRWTRSRFRLSVRTLLGITVFFALLFGVFTKLRPALEQRRLVQSIERLGGRVLYDLEIKYWDDWFVTPSGSVMPRWLHTLFGNDFLASVNHVEFRGIQLTDSDLRSLAALRAMELLALNNTGATDAGLVYLADHPKLLFLSVEACPITDDGLGATRRHSQPQVPDFE